MPSTKVATLEVKYSFRDGLHVFSSTDLTGLLVAHTDPEVAFNDVARAIETLLELNEGVKAKVEPAASFEEFRRAVRMPDVPHPAVIEYRSRTYVVKAI